MDKVLSLEANISVITKIETLSYTPENSIFEQKIKAFITNANVYSLDDSIIETTIELRKKYRMKIGDAIIAATAQHNSFIIVTNNERDFNKVKGLKILNPFKL